MPSFPYSEAAPLAIAALVGLAVGIEREWAGHASGPHARFAGVRTFLLLGILGGGAGLLFSSDFAAAGAVLLGGAAAFIAIAYFLAAKRPGSDLDGTTEGAALVVLTLSTLAGTGRMALAGGAVAVVVLALRMKEELHALVRRIGETELRAALQFAVLALVVLPLLPSGPYGPLGGIRPRALWAIVLILAGVNFLAYIARRAIGAARGYTVTGLFGGIVSSTAVTFQFARESAKGNKSSSQRKVDEGKALAGGVLAACTVLVPRVAIVTAVLNTQVALALVPYLIPPMVAGALLTAAAFRGPASPHTDPDDSKSPLGLVSALKMALFFQLFIALIVLVQTSWGSAGVVATATAMGMTDMDALTVSMSRLGESTDQVQLAARGIGVGLLSNTLFKLTVAMILGSNSFRRAAGAGLLALAMASVLGLWLGAQT